MYYKALKPCKFAGKAYKIGDSIDASVVLPTAAPGLIKIGKIAAVEGAYADTDPAGTAPTAGGPLLPPASTIDEQKDSETEEEEKLYSKNALSRMTKPEVMAIAEEKGVEATEDMTKDKIVELILESQGE